MSQQLDLLKSIDNEVWLPITGYDGYYSVSASGKVASCDRTVLRNNGKHVFIPGSIKRPVLRNNGYYMVSLYKNNIEKSFLLHRLIAQHFIPNPNNHPIINHINGVKTDNSIANLEWCDYPYNSKHSYHVLGLKWVKFKPIAKISGEEIIEVYNGAQECANKNNISRFSVCASLTGLREIKCIKGLFKYISKEEYEQFKKPFPVR